MRKIKEMQNCKNLKTILNGNLNSITMLQHYLMITFLVLALLLGLKLAKVIKMYFCYYSMDKDDDDKISKEDWYNALQKAGAKVTM